MCRTSPKVEMLWTGHVQDDPRSQGSLLPVPNRRETWERGCRKIIYVLLMLHTNTLNCDSSGSLECSENQHLSIAIPSKNIGSVVNFELLKSVTMSGRRDTQQEIEGEILLIDELAVLEFSYIVCSFVFCFLFLFHTFQCLYFFMPKAPIHRKLKT